MRSGGGYNESHVQRLQKQLKQPLTCLSDKHFSLDCVRILPLMNNWEGWWSKIELFRLHGPTVYFDLDVTIVGDPHELYRKEFTMWQDPYYPNAFNSSVMSWDRTPTSVYEKFARDPKPVMNRKRRFPMVGDQGFIQENTEPKAFEPGLVRSYKADVKANGVTPSDGTVVVAYHGKPKPWDLECSK